MYRVFLTDIFKKKIENIPENIREKIRAKIFDFVVPQLKQEPHFGANIRKLRDWTPPTWRYRLGSFRLFYIIDEIEKVVAFVSLDDRKASNR